MPKFAVTFEQVIYYELIVDASDKEAASKIAENATFTDEEHLSSRSHLEISNIEEISNG